MPNLQELIDNFSWYAALFVFFAYTIIDLLYADYIISVSRKEPMRSASVSAVIYSLLAFGVITYSQNPLYVIPLGIGAFVGTYLTVKYRK